MTTPQNPGDSDTPQDPSDPQNPYGTAPSTPPPPPPPYVPPADPTADPAPAPTDPAPPTTSIPPATPSGAPPPYGQPAPSQPAYGQPAYAQPAYGQPSYPQTGPMPGQDSGTGEAGKGMAITALILSFICCLDVVGIILAIVVLVRSRDGRNHGKGLAIAALVIGVITLILTVGGVALLGNWAKDFKSVNDLKPGDCITAKGLTDEGSDTIDTIRTVKCSEKHDGEVLATTDVTAELAKDFSQMDPAATCSPAIEAAGKSALLTESINVTALTEPDPKKGDNIACVAYNNDGSKLTSELGS